MAGKGQHHVIRMDKKVLALYKAEIKKNGPCSKALLRLDLINLKRKINIRRERFLLCIRYLLENFKNQVLFKSQTVLKYNEGSNKL